jgi:hypothetical protein
MRITQTTCFLLSLLTDAMQGRMLPAAMQRPYVWLKDDVEALCDSILSGFPVGSFLLWEPGPKADLSKVAKGRLGPVLAQDDSGKAYTPTQLLLDGQNRLATLAWLMNADFNNLTFEVGVAETATWLSGQRLVLDYESRSIKFVPVAEADVGLRLPAWSLLSCQPNAHSVNMNLIRKSWDMWTNVKGYPEDQVEDMIKFHDKCADAFRDARTAITVIENATPDEARSAFLRICRVGVQMSQEDFDKAVNWSAQTA